MGRPSTPFMVLGGIMILLFIIGLILIAVLISRNNTPEPQIGLPTSLSTQIFETQVQASTLEAQTQAASTTEP